MLSNNMPNLNVTNSLTILHAGVYEINYYCNLSLSLAASVSLSIRQNGTIIPSTTLSRTLNASTTAMLINSVILNLQQNDVIDMAFTSTLAATATLSNGVNASFSVKKIN